MIHGRKNCTLDKGNVAPLFLKNLWPLLELRPKIKFCLFPLSDQPTKIAATQKILLHRLMKYLFF
jgi:hypothetical protein